MASMENFAVGFSLTAERHNALDKLATHWLDNAPFTQLRMGEYLKAVFACERRAASAVRTKKP